MKINTNFLFFALIYLNNFPTSICLDHSVANADFYRKNITINTSSDLFNESFQKLNLHDAIAKIKKYDANLYKMLQNLKPNDPNSSIDKDIVLTFKKLISNVKTASSDLTQLHLTTGKILNQVKTSGKNNNCLLHSLITTAHGLGLKDGYKNEETFAKHLREKLKFIWENPKKIEEYISSNFDAKQIIHEFLDSNYTSNKEYLITLELILKYFLQTNQTVTEIQSSENIKDDIKQYLGAYRTRKYSQKLNYLADEIKTITANAASKKIDITQFVKLTTDENISNVEQYYNTHLLPKIQQLHTQISYINKLASYVFSALNSDKKNGTHNVTDVTAKDYLDFTYHLPLLLIYLKEEYHVTFNVILIRNPQKLMHFHRALHVLYMNGYEFDRTIFLHHDKNKAHFSAYQ